MGIVEGIVIQANILHLGASSSCWESLIVAGAVEAASSHIEPATCGVLGGTWLLTLAVGHTTSSFLRGGALRGIEASVPFGCLGDQMSVIWTLDLS